MSKILLLYSNFSVHCKNIITKIDNIVDLDIEKICIDNVKIRKLLAKTNVKVVPHLLITQDNLIKEEIRGSDVNTWFDSLLEDIQSKKDEERQRIEAEREMREREMREREMREREMREREMREREMREREMRQREMREREMREVDDDQSDFNSLDSLGIQSRPPNKKVDGDFSLKGTNFREGSDFAQQQMERHKNPNIQKTEPMKKIKEEPDGGGAIDINDMVTQMEKSRADELEKLKVK